MRNIIYLIFISSIFIGCNSPKEIFKTECMQLNKKVENKFLSELNANKNHYSVLIFTSVFDATKIHISNNNLICDKVFTSDLSLGLAESIRVDNRYNTRIVEGKYDFIIKKRNLKKYKYIYIERNQFKTTKQYKITYSNILCGFY